MPPPRSLGHETQPRLQLTGCRHLAHGRRPTSNRRAARKHAAAEGKGMAFEDHAAFGGTESATQKRDAAGVPSAYEGDNRGLCLRNLRQAPELRQARLALPRADQPPLEPEYSARSRPRQRRSQARQRLHVLPQGGQDRARSAPLSATHAKKGPMFGPFLLPSEGGPTAVTRLSCP